MAKARNNIVVEVDSPIEETCAAMMLIKKLGQKNELPFDLSIAYDFDYDGEGVYYPTTRRQRNRIFINPFRCRKQEETIRNNGEEPFCPGYTADLTLFGVTLHEFSHFLTWRIFPRMMDDFKRTFPRQRLYLNDYCNNEYYDELAEILTLYITNPFLLKLISKEHWEFCRSYFKSPVACTKQKFEHIYQGYPIHVKEHLREKWGIIYNICTEEFERI